MSLDITMHSHPLFNQNSHRYVQIEVSRFAHDGFNPNSIGDSLIFILDQINHAPNEYRYHLASSIRQWLIDNINVYYGHSAQFLIDQLDVTLCQYQFNLSHSN